METDVSKNGNMTQFLIRFHKKAVFLKILTLKNAFFEAFKC